MGRVVIEGQHMKPPRLHLWLSLSTHPAHLLNLYVPPPWLLVECVERVE